MPKKMQRRFLSDLGAILLDKPFLQKSGIPRKEIQALLRNEAFAASLCGIFPIHERISCGAVLGCCRGALADLAPEPEEGWLAFTHRYAVNLLFPDPDFEPRALTCGTGALFLLAVLQAVFDVERRSLPFDPLLDFAFLSEEEYQKCDRREEYARFLGSFRSEFVYELMRLGREVTPFHTLEHIAGVHYVAMTVARGLCAGGAPVDPALVSGAAAAHDIGKFGCKPDERVPYLHYYYTDRWCASHGLPGIGHIAANHSTWDLELENLSAESLVLIYADFRVKQSRDRDGRELTEIYPLDESFQVILSKLDNVDEQKRRRYRFVYAKLRDFEDYMRGLGVDIGLTGRPQPVPVRRETALMDSAEVVEAITMTAVEHNIEIMYRLSHERRFGNLLEAARSEKDWKRTRAYLNIFEEYFAYISPTQKVQTLGFLYELLMHREGDIRRQAADLIGNIIARFNNSYRKELPRGVADLSEQTPFSLWVQYLDMIVYPDHKLTPQQKSFIGYTLKIVVSAVLDYCSPEDARQYLEAFLRYYDCPELLEEGPAFALLDAMLYLPLTLCTPGELDQLYCFASYFAGREPVQLTAASLRYFKRITGELPASASCCRETAKLIGGFDNGGNITLLFLQCKILQNLGLDAAPLEQALYEHDVVSDIFLDNLKTATPWILKAVNIELLVDQVEHGIHDRILHISAHFSNLIKVSERVVVRHSAGAALLKVAPLLALDQRNEIAVELTKGLEVGGYEFSKYIPEYLGELALLLHPKELDELIDGLRSLLGSTDDRIVSVALHTVGVLLECCPVYPRRFLEADGAFERRRRRLLGMLLDGLANYRPEVRQEALSVIGKVIFGSKRLSHEQKAGIFTLSCKKLLFLSEENSGRQLTFFYRAAALSHIYRFISLQRIDYGPFCFEHRDKIAFFPGTFDPFTLSHKGIVRAIRDLGFEVYLAVDEFSWSKKTQPHLIRRQIVSMSVADEFHVHLFPDDIPVNLANPADLKRLSETFAGRELYIAVGSDVVRNASSYQAEPSDFSIHRMNHIVFRRASGLDGDTSSEIGNLSCITGKVIELSLPTHLEEISSTRIRENIDLNRDISALIDPVVQEFIYHNSLYLREPQYKPTLRPQDIRFDVVENPGQPLREELGRRFLTERGEQPVCLPETPGMLMVMRDTARRRPLGFARYRLVSSAELFGVLGSAALAEEVRQKAAGRILLISGIYTRRSEQGYDFEQLLLSEVLAAALADGCGYCICFAESGVPVAAFSHAGIAALERQGFVRAAHSREGRPLFVADMRSPLVLLQNLETTIKEPFSSNDEVLLAIRSAHRRLQMAATQLFPGNLVLSLSYQIIHHRLVERITTLNEVPNYPTRPRALGKLMCVPFGKMLRGKAVPNTVTKTLHTDKVYTPDLRRHSIESFPYYTSLPSQIATIKSFNRPVILVDDLVHGGDRIRALHPMFNRAEVEIRTVLVGLLSGRGRDLMSVYGLPIDSVYYMPNLRYWFVESTLYPFIGGDTVQRERQPVAGLLPGINMIFPYAAPQLPSDCSRRALFEFSCCCIENARDLFIVLEAKYREHFARNLTLSRLSEAVILPLAPDKGSCMAYDPNLAASVYLENDLEMLRRSYEKLF